MVSLAIGLVGVFVGVLTLGQSLAILTFGIPTARQWLRDGRLTDARPLRRYRRTLLTLAVILAMSLAAVWFLFPQRLLAFAAGLGIGVIGGLGGLRKKDDLLADFVQANASSIRRDVSQSHELKEDAKRLGVSLHEVAAAPHRAMQIIEDFSRLMQDTPCQVRPESMLPYPKPVIEEALRKALVTFSDAESRAALQTALSELDTFVPDHEVPEDPNERALQYIRRRGLRGKAGGER